MKSIRILSVAAFCLTLLPGAVLARGKMEEINNPTIKLETKANAAQIKKGVKMAVLNRKWNITNDKGNEFDADAQQMWGRNRWSAKIHVSISGKAVTIKYVSSEALSANGNMIHPTYNKIVGFLESDIPIYVEREVVASQ